MCGIAGVLSSETGIDLLTILDAMNRVQRHRGPDDGGVALLSTVPGGLANRRLAIRDPSPAGHMPMSDASGAVTITYNGEIYNAAELRLDLERRGVLFRSGSDTEVILHGYAVWGEAVVERLRGIFALAIADERPECRRLVLARDRMGVKPLYYASLPRAFIFASEVKGVLASGLVGREIDSAGLVGYLLLGSVPNPFTIRRDVRGLEPGCLVSVSLDRPTCGIESRRYWSMPVRERALTREDAVEEVGVLLREAVCEQLVSDVPIGAFLSGGLDSSVIVSLTRLATQTTLRTCSIAFEDREYDESKYARAVARATGVEHVERVVSEGEMRSEIPAVLAAMDQPAPDGVNTYFVSQTARQMGLTVALSGLGGDELFGGYDSTFAGVPQLLRAVRTIQRVPGAPALIRAGIGASPWRDRLVKAGSALARPAHPASAYLARRGVFSPEETRALVGEARWRDAALSFDAVAHIVDRAVRDGHDSRFETRPFSWLSRAELGMYTHNQLLADTDVMSMAHSLEVRVPLLDHRLVEAVLTLPDPFKWSAIPKALLRDAAGPYCPPEALAARPKQGFTFPLDLWLRGSLAPVVEDLILDGCGRGVVDRWQAERVVTRFRAGHLHWSRPWTLAALAAVKLS